MTGGIIVSISAWHWIVICYTSTCALRNCLKFSCQDKSTTLALHLGSLSNIMLEKSPMKQRDSVTRTGTSYSGTALNLCREVRSEDVCLCRGLYNLNNLCPCVGRVRSILIVHPKIPWTKHVSPHCVWTVSHTSPRSINTAYELLVPL